MQKGGKRGSKTWTGRGGEKVGQWKEKIWSGVEQPPFGENPVIRKTAREGTKNQGDAWGDLIQKRFRKEGPYQKKRERKRKIG